MSTLRIAVYRDEGADPRGVRETVRTLRLLEPRSTFKLVKAPFFSEKKWEQEVDVLVFPGGRDLPYVDALSGERCGRIRDFVLAGGRYFGICAGAYFASKYIEFEKGEELEVCGHRELGFFPGTAVGPLFEKNVFRYNSLEGARAAPIIWKREELHVFYHGGCAFERAHEYENVKTLANYSSLYGAPCAAIVSMVGRGKALLSGVHLEYCSTSCKKFPFYLELAKSQKMRLEMLRDFWRNLIKD